MVAALLSNPIGYIKRNISDTGYNKGTLQAQTKTTQTVRILCEATNGVFGYVDAVLVGRWF